MIYFIDNTDESYDYISNNYESDLFGWHILTNTLKVNRDTKTFSYAFDHEVLFLNLQDNMEIIKIEDLISMDRGMKIDDICT